MPPTVPPTPPTPPADPNAEWTAAEVEWFKAHGVTEEKEKEAIRGRARVLEYARHKQDFEEKKKTPADPEKKPWYNDF